MLITDLSTYLQTNGIGTEGTNLFIGRLPEVDGQNVVVMLDQTGGVEPQKDLPIITPTVQVTVRATTYSGGIAKINAIYTLLHRKDDSLVLVLGGVDVMNCFALQEPTHLGEDDSGRHLFTCNFVFKLRN